MGYLLASVVAKRPSAMYENSFIFGDFLFLQIYLSVFQCYILCCLLVSLPAIWRLSVIIEKK